MGDGLHEILQDCVARGWEVVIEQRPSMVRLLSSGAADGGTWQAWFDSSTHRLALVRWSFDGVLPADLRVARRMLGSAGKQVTGSDVDARLGAAWPSQADGFPGLWVSSFEGMSLGFDGEEDGSAEDRSRLRLRHVWVHAKGASPAEPVVPRMRVLSSGMEDARAGGSSSEAAPAAACSWLEERLGPRSAAAAVASMEAHARTGLRSLCAVLGPATDDYPWLLLWLPGRGPGAWLVASGRDGSSEDDVLAAMGAPMAHASVRPLMSSIALGATVGAAGGAARSGGRALSPSPSSAAGRYRACCWSEREGVDLLLCPVRRTLLGVAATVDEPGHRDFGAVARASFAIYVVDGAHEPGAAPAGAKAAAGPRPKASAAGAPPGAGGKARPSPGLSLLAGDVRPQPSAPGSDSSDASSEASGSSGEESSEEEEEEEEEEESDDEEGGPVEPRPARSRDGGAGDERGSVGRAVSCRDAAAVLTSEASASDWVAALGTPLRPVFVPAPRGAVSEAGPDRDGLCAADFGPTEAIMWPRGVMVECTGRKHVARVTLCVGPPE